MLALATLPQVVAATGFEAGSAAEQPDSAATTLPARTPSRPPKEARFQPGDSLILVLKDGTRTAGKLEDLGRIPAAAYRDRYDRWRQEAGERAELPDIGATIQLVTGRMGRSRAVFQGFGQEGIEVTAGTRSAVRTVEFFRFSSLIIPGNRRWKHQELNHLCWRGDAPLLTALKVEVGGDSRLIPLDEVVSAQSRASGAPVAAERCLFGDRSTSGQWQVAVEAGALRAGSPSDLGVVASGMVLRACPPASVRSLGLDAAFGLIRDQTGGGAIGVDLELAAAASIPLGGRRFGLQPRAGAGILAGGGLRVLNWTLGAGLMAGLTPGFGVRLDYTYHRLIGEGYNYQSLSSVYLGPFWSR